MIIQTGDTLVSITAELSLTNLAAAIEECRTRDLVKQEQDELIAAYLNKSVSATKKLLRQLENAGVIKYEYQQSGKMINISRGANKFMDHEFEPHLRTAIINRYEIATGDTSKRNHKEHHLLAAIDREETGVKAACKAKKGFEQTIGNEILAVVQEQDGAWISQTDITAIVKEERPESSRNIVSRILEKLVRGNFLEYKRTGGGYRGGGWSYRLTEHTKPGDYKVAL